VHVPCQRFTRPGPLPLWRGASRPARLATCTAGGGGADHTGRPCRHGDTCQHAGMADGAQGCVTHLGVSPDLQARTGCGATRLLTVFEPSACKEGAALRQAPSPRDQLQPTTQYDPLSGHSCCCRLVRQDKNRKQTTPAAGASGEHGPPGACGPGTARDATRSGGERERKDHEEDKVCAETC
jgi:hypothetical protein